MSIRINNDFAIMLADAAVDVFDGGELAVYSGTRPANADTAIGAQVKLVDFVMGTPAFGAAVNAGAGGTATAEDVAAVTALATGTATFFRLTNVAGTRTIDGTVTDTTGAGDLKLSSTSVISGIDVTVVSLTVTMPRGA